MTLLEALAVYLASKSQITDIASTRIYRLKRPKNTSLPAITYRKLWGQDQLYQAGTSTLAEVRVRITCWAAAPNTAESLRSAVRDVLQRYSGTITDDEENVTIILARLEGDAEDYDEPEDASDNGTYVAPVDVHIWWRPTAPSP